MDQEVLEFTPFDSEEALKRLEEALAVLPYQLEELRRGRIISNECLYSRFTI